MKAIPAAALATLALAGCAKKSEKMFRDEAAAPLAAMASKPMAGAANDDSRARADPAQTSDNENAAPAINVSVAPMLAYSYSYTIETPANRVEALQKLHQDACTHAGPNVCQVISQSLSRNSEDRIEGALSIRATPAWLNGFRGGLSAQARDAGGKLVKSAVDSEDLTREIVDTEAALRAKITLRDRLQTLLASHPGKVSDLLDVERELARVQGEIDAAQSELTVMRGRVTMSVVSIDYSSEGVLAPAGAWSPLSSALRGFVSLLAATLGAMVSFIAIVLPWGLALAGLLWLLRGRIKWRPRRRTAPAD